PARQAQDTVKRAPAEGGAVLETVPRETIWLAQTPQGFRRAVLADAMETTGGADVTDEAMMAERAGHPVHVVEGDESNVKITTAEDLVLARRLVPRSAGREGGSLGEGGRDIGVGTGYDLHRLTEGRKLVLAGVEIPFDKGPLGHSDGDVVSHALCDALLGAAALGDIGGHFPDNDPRWKDAAGLDLLGRTVTRLGEAGWVVTSVDVTVLLEKPKLAPFKAAIIDALRTVLGETAVSIKAKTNEGVDAVGRGEAIAAHAVAVVTRHR
ncbi:MAG TPA: 2-C-methyl-D-erythritol 2,4-cyclodiphosphate synthase, partial [Vicinamibacterales bacterium]|nr:2-C-methyl-D-erythritol 2,4-cyclodiphosphate synthase [Vicinamibacterales bacterium]